MFPPVGGQVACPDCPAEGRVARVVRLKGSARMPLDALSLTSTAMSYPVTSQPQCANTCYQTQLSDWHTGLTDCCNDMPVCECPGEMGREGSSPHIPAIFTLPGIPSSNPHPPHGDPTPSSATNPPHPEPDCFESSFPSL